MKISVNKPEAKGEVELEENPYGVTVKVNGRTVVTIDLFYLSDEALFTDLNLGEYYDESEIEDGIAIRGNIGDDGNIRRVVVLPLEKDEK